MVSRKRKFSMDWDQPQQDDIQKRRKGISLSREKANTLDISLDKIKLKQKDNLLNTISFGTMKDCEATVKKPRFSLDKALLKASEDQPRRKDLR